MVNENTWLLGRLRGRLGAGETARLAVDGDAGASAEAPARNQPDGPQPSVPVGQRPQARRLAASLARQADFQGRIVGRRCRINRFAKRRLAEDLQPFVQRQPFRRCRSQNGIAWGIAKRRRIERWTARPGALVILEGVVVVGHRTSRPRNRNGRPGGQGITVVLHGAGRSGGRRIGDQFRHRLGLGSTRRHLLRRPIVVVLDLVLLLRPVVKQFSKEPIERAELARVVLGLSHAG